MGGKSNSAASPIPAPTNRAAGDWIPRTAIPQALRGMAMSRTGPHGIREICC